jgi:hypothetical protein
MSSYQALDAEIDVVQNQPTPLPICDTGLACHLRRTIAITSYAERANLAFSLSPSGRIPGRLS